MHRRRFARGCDSREAQLRGFLGLGASTVQIARKSSRRWLARIKHLSLSEGDWSYSRPLREDDPAQGWKLHVSATILSAGEVFARAEPILREKDAFFKVPRRLDLLRSL